MTFIVRFLGLIALFVGLLAAPAALACSCARPDPDEFVAGIAILFEGTMVRSEHVKPPEMANCKGGFGGECAETVQGVFVVHQVYKGELGKEVRVTYARQDGVNCGASFRPNIPVTVAAYGDAENGYGTSMCTQRPVSYEPYRTKVLEAAALYRQGLDALDAAIAKDAAGSEPRMAKAHFLYETNSKAAALAIAEDVLKGEPANGDAAVLSAQILRDGKKDEEAIAILDRYLALRQDDHAARHARVASLIRLGRLAEVPADWKDYSELAVDKVSFAGKSLDSASFHQAKMREASFEGASLRGADFSESNLTYARFDDADLKDADLGDADIRASFAGANLKGANLVGSVFRVGPSDSVDMTGADLRRAAFYLEHKSSLTQLKASGIKAEGVHFEVRNMAGADFSNADLKRAIFYFPDLTGANFHGANLTYAEFRNGMSDPQIDLRGVDFTGAKLDNASFGVSFYDCKTIWPSGFDIGKYPFLTPAPGSEDCTEKTDFSWLKEKARTGDIARDYPSAAFRDMKLDGVSFRGSWLPGEYFWNASLRGADFTLTKGKLDLRGVDASGADFSYVNFRGSNLYGVGGPAAILDGARFRGAIVPLRSLGAGRGDMPDADLSKADLRGVIFPDEPAKWPANVHPVAAGVVFLKGHEAKSLYPNYSLKSADLKGFDLSFADFAGFDLSGADLRGTYLYDVNLSGAKLDGAKVKGACYAENTQWPSGFDFAGAGAIFCGRVGYSDPMYSDISSGWSASRGGIEKAARWYLAPEGTPVADFRGENWDEVVWLAAWLPGSKMDGGSFVHAMMKGANLNGASLAGADLTGADLRDSLIEGANLSGANLEEADLRKASLKSSKLDGTRLQGAVFDAKTTWPAGFDPIKAGARME